MRGGSVCIAPQKAIRAAAQPAYTTPDAPSWASGVSIYILYVSLPLLQRQHEGDEVVDLLS